MVRRGSKNGHHNDMSLKQSGLHAPNMITILGFIVNIILHDHRRRKRIFTLIMNRISI